MRERERLFPKPQLLQIIIIIIIFFRSSLQETILRSSLEETLLPFFYFLIFKQIKNALKFFLNNNKKFNKIVS